MSRARHAAPRPQPPRHRQAVAGRTAACTCALLGAALALTAGVDQPVAPAWAEEATRALPPELEPVLRNVQLQLRQAPPPQRLARAEIVISANAVRFVSPTDGAALLVLQELNTPPWFAATQSQVSAQELQLCLRLLGQQLPRSPWRLASTLTSSEPRVRSADLWQREPLRPRPWLLAVATLGWTAVVLGALRLTRKETSTDLRR